MTPPAPRKQRLRALIVEDSQDDALLEAMELERSGYRLHWRRVEDHEEMARALADEPWDLVLCDHALPRFDSFQALTTLSTSQHGDTPMIIVSGAIGEETAAAVIRSGAADFVNKNNLERLPIATARVLRDASSRRAVARTEAQFRSAFDDAAFGSAIVALDGDVGRLIRVNRSLCDAIRRNRRDLVRTRLQALVHADDRAALERGLRELSEERRSILRGEARYSDATGKERWCLFSLSAVREESAKPTCAIAQFIDITVRRRSEEALRLAHTQALAAAEMQSEFVANMNHEIRTPLNGVLGLTELLADTKLTDEQRDYVSALHISGQALMSVIEPILNFSKIEAGMLELDSEDFDPRTLVDHALATVASVAEQKGVSLSAWIDPKVPARLRADASRIRQVLTNLLGNAVKFTHGGGEIAVQLRSEREHLQAFRCEVTDTGIGIEPDELDRIFEPFKQADGSMTRRYGGTGLGLTIAKQLVELMGGTIGVRSTPGDGSTFWFQVPFETCAEPDIVRGPAGESPGEQSAPINGEHGKLGLRNGAGGIRVLLVEDDQINQMVAEQLLKRAGHQVEIANNGAEAVELTRANDYDIVLMDCQMPELDGYEATRSIRRYEGSDRHVPIVAMTAHTMLGDREKCLASGMDDYLAKPLTREELDRIMSHWPPRPNGSEAVAPVAEMTLRRPRGAHGPLDAAGVRRLRTEFGSTGALARLVELFATQTPERLTGMRSAIEAGETTTVRDGAHKVKGGCLTLAATHMAELCEDLETLAGAGSLEGANALVDEIETAFDEAHAALLAQVS